MNTPVKDHYNSPESAQEVARQALLPIELPPPSYGWDAFIRAMQLLLPVGALILGVLTAGWPFLNDTEVSFTLSKDDVAKSDDVVRMTKMNYVGTDQKNRLFRIFAADGEQDTPSAPRVRLTDIHAEMELTPGNNAVVDARTGIYRVQEASLSLVGGVVLNTANGYSLTMDGAEIDLKERLAVGQGNIDGTADLGKLSATKVTLKVEEREAVFEGGVTLHIKPDRQPSSPQNAGQ